MDATPVSLIRIAGCAIAILCDRHRPNNHGRRPKRACPRRLSGGKHWLPTPLSLTILLPLRTRRQIVVEPCARHSGGCGPPACWSCSAFLVLYPVAMLLLGALTNTNPVVDGFGVFDLSFANFITVLGNPNVHVALANSLIACGGGTALAVVIGLTFSWVVVRTNTPVQGLHRGRQHAAAVRAAAGRSRRLVDPRLAEDADCSTRCWPAIGIDWRFNVYSMGGHDRDLRHLLRALRLHVHGVGAAQHGPVAGGGRRGHRRQRAAHACSR